MNAQHDPFPMPAGADLDDCRIADRVALVALLEEIVERRTLVTVYLNEGREFIVTSLLAVNPDFEELVIDHGANESVNEHLADAARLTFVTTLDHIRIQFHTGGARDTAFEGLPAFRVRLPTEVLRLQRRNAYRVKLPPNVHCRLPCPDGDAVSLRILDLSVGGIALIAPQETFDPAIGSIIRDCLIELPDNLPITADLEVRYGIVYANTARGVVKRFGCRFVNLPGPTAALIQRVILFVERAHLV